MAHDVRLKKPLERALRGGAPWIFRDALDRPAALPDGALVRVLGKDGRGCATGFWSARSPIAVRVLAAAPLPDPRAEVDRRLRAALARRRKLFAPAETNAFRWVHGEADLLPGLHVDLYDDVAVVRFDGPGPRAFYRDAGPRLAAAALPLVLRAAVDREDGAPLLGTPPPTMVVRENRLVFEVAPGHGGKGGLFLDQRDNRARVERLARGRTVLNLFGATGGFSLAAARGGALSTDTVDVARPALAAARRNFALNALPAATARFHAADAFEFLADAAGREDRWSLVISDPPSFAPSRAALPRALRAYRRLHAACAAVAAPGAVFCAASCSSHVRADDFLRTLHDGCRDAGRRVRLLESAGAAPDHPVIDAFPEGDYLKFLVARLD